MPRLPRFGPNLNRVSVEIKLLQSFLAIASEGSITRAAEVLHITQPALSRQLVQLEKELDCELFIRGKRHMTLTDEGLLLERRAREILSLVALTEDELAAKDELLEGTISIGTGEFTSMKRLASLIASFHQRYPHVKFDLLAGVADQVAERLDRGLLDFGLFIEPVEKKAYDYRRMPEPEKWVAAMRVDDPLAACEVITAEDLKDRSLILPIRPAVQNELAQWFGNTYESLKKSFHVSLGGMASIMVKAGLGVLIWVEGSSQLWNTDQLCTRDLSPALTGSTLLAWKHDVTQTAAVNAFIEHVCAELDALNHNDNA